MDSRVSVCVETITNRVCEYILSMELDANRKRGIGTDGASTMIGRHMELLRVLR